MSSLRDIEPGMLVDSYRGICKVISYHSYCRMWQVELQQPISGRFLFMDTNHLTPIDDVFDSILEEERADS